jgi:TonB family protein
MSALIRVSVLLTGVLASPAVAETPLQPTEKWVLNYEDAQCHAYRNYGTEENPLYLAFKAPPVGSVVQLMVLQNGPRMNGEQHDIQVKIDHRPPLKTNMLVYRGKKGKFRIKLINLPREEFAAFRDARIVEIEGVGQDYSFALSDAGPLMKALDDCLTDLRGYFNVSPPDAPNSRLTRGPVGDLQNVFKPEDYPWTAVHKRLQGSATMEILIDEKGAVADCSITETSGYATIDAQSCAIIQERAKFEPAIDMQGKPTRSSYSQRIIWKLR